MGPQDHPLKLSWETMSDWQDDVGSFAVRAELIARAFGLDRPYANKRTLSALEHYTCAVVASQQDRYGLEGLWPNMPASLERAVKNYVRGEYEPPQGRLESLISAIAAVVSKHGDKGLALPSSWATMDVQALADALNVQPTASRSNRWGKRQAPNTRAKGAYTRQMIEFEIPIRDGDLDHIRSKYFGVWTAFRRSHRSRTDFVTPERLVVSEGSAGGNPLVTLFDHDGNRFTGRVVVSHEQLLMIFVGLGGDPPSYSTGVLAAQRDVVRDNGQFNLTFGYRLRQSGPGTFVAYKTLLLRQPDFDSKYRENGIDGLPKYKGPYGPGTYLYDRLAKLFDAPNFPGMNHVGNLQFPDRADFREELLGFKDDESLWHLPFSDVEKDKHGGVTKKK